MSRKLEIFAALEEIRQKDPQGLLRPDAIVKAAKPKKHVLHTEFTWNERKAAQERRLDQARSLVRIAVTVIQEERAAIRAYVSLTSDRKNGGGYRLTTSVMSDEAMRAEMLEDARDELRAFRRKYARLTELAPLWAMLESVTAGEKKKAG